MFYSSVEARIQKHWSSQGCEVFICIYIFHRFPQKTFPKSHLNFVHVWFSHFLQKILHGMIKRLKNVTWKLPKRIIRPKKTKYAIHLALNYAAPVVGALCHAGIISSKKGLVYESHYDNGPRQKRDLTRRVEIWPSLCVRSS